MRRIATAWLAALVLGVAAAAFAHDPRSIAVGRNGMVASDSAVASRIGAAVLKGGGNAFDAAVATSLALTVARPESTGLGGGGFMLAYVAGEQRFVVLDFRETAPASATAERYATLRAQAPDGPSASVCGGNAVGVPGLAAGLSEISARFGSRPLSELIQPAIELAERGLEVDEHYREACRVAVADFDRWPEFGTRFAALRSRLLGGDGGVPAHGARIPRPDLAQTLRTLAQSGLGAFYHGPIAEAIVRGVRQAGGEMTLDDLGGYRVVEREPIRGRYRGFEIVTIPPPSSGGACLIETLQVLAACETRPDYRPAEHRPHALVEAFKHAFADRARWFGDPQFCDIPFARLLSAEYAAELAARIDWSATRAPESYGTPALVVEDSGTSHFCVADRLGNVVAMTETINGGFGSFVLVEPLGILLNNELDDFLTVRGEPNLFGLVQSEANLVAPGKRPLSSMAPTIILRDGRPMLAIGASGGPRIITAVAQAALDVMNGETLHDAVSAPRLHHQWQPDEVYFDREPPRHVREKLALRGHKLSEKRKTAAVQAIQLHADGTMVGASDPGKGGEPAGAE